MRSNSPLAISLGLLVAMAAPAIADDFKLDEKSVIAWVEEFGGKVERDQGIPGSPIVKVVLDEVELKDTDLAKLAVFPQLRSLEISHLKVTGAMLANVAKLKVLCELDLHCASLTDENLAPVANMTQLETLYLGWNQLTDAGLEHLQKLTGLRSLDVGANQITDKGLSHLKDLGKLRVLHLSCCSVTSDGLCPLLGNWPSLKTLYVWSNMDIDDRCVPKLKELCELEELGILGTRISEKGEDELKAALPKLKISGGHHFEGPEGPPPVPDLKVYKY